MASQSNSLCWGNVLLGGGESFNAKMELVGVIQSEEHHSETTCVEAAGGARSSVKELLCAT